MKGLRSASEMESQTDISCECFTEHCRALSIGRTGWYKILCYKWAHCVRLIAFHSSLNFTRLWFYVRWMKADILETWFDTAGQTGSEAEGIKRERRKIKQLLYEIRVRLQIKYNKTQNNTARVYAVPVVMFQFLLHTVGTVMSSFFSFEGHFLTWAEVTLVFMLQWYAKSKYKVHLHQESRI